MKEYKFKHTDISGIIFDLDGVITDTASIHKIAWKKTFDECLKNISKNNTLKKISKFISNQGLSI